MQSIAGLFIFAILIIFQAVGCSRQQLQYQPTDFVNLFIGILDRGNAVPAATAPFREEAHLIFAPTSCANGITGEPDMASLEKYRKQLSSLRAEFSEYQLPQAKFFLFGMGNREKLLYKQGCLFSVGEQRTLFRWEVKDEIIIPNDYSVFLTTHDDKRISIYENEQGVYLETDGKIDVLSKDHPLTLATFEGHPYSEVLKVLNHEKLINIDNGLPLPNFFVYRKPWRRDAAMMAMCMEIAGNLDLIKDWVLGHTFELYADPLFLKHIRGAILWTAGKE